MISLFSSYVIFNNILFLIIPPQIMLFSIVCIICICFLWWSWGGEIAGAVRFNTYIAAGSCHHFFRAQHTISTTLLLTAFLITIVVWFCRTTFITIILFTSFSIAYVKTPFGFCTIRIAIWKIDCSVIDFSYACANWRAYV